MAVFQVTFKLKSNNEDLTYILNATSTAFALNSAMGKFLSSNESDEYDIHRVDVTEMKNTVVFEQ